MVSWPNCTPARRLVVCGRIQGMGVFPFGRRPNPGRFSGRPTVTNGCSAPRVPASCFSAESTGIIAPAGSWLEQRRARTRLQPHRTGPASRCVPLRGRLADMAGLLALGASLRLLQQFGLSPQQSPIASRVLELTDPRLPAIERHRRSGREHPRGRTPLGYRRLSYAGPRFADDQAALPAAGRRRGVPGWLSAHQPSRLCQ